ncbi:MAG: M28 family peptidase [Balneolaceae bacterium]
MKRYFIALLVLITACSIPPAEQGAETIFGDTMLNHIQVLASDEFEGRAPASPGEDRTVNYLIEQLEQMGVQPGMPDGSFTQQVPLLGQRVNRNTARMTLVSGASPNISLTYLTDFMAWPANEAETVDLRRAELLYVGYGIQAPEFDWDDYKGADVEGKVLVFKNSDPSHDPEIFEGDSRLYYGRWSYKFEMAEEMGALGAIIIHTTPTAGYGWDVVANSWGRERFSLKGGESGTARPEFSAWMTQPASSRLFESAGLDLDQMLDAAADRNFEPVPLNGVQLDLFLEAEYSDMSTRNVIGLVEGTDPDLKDEYVIFSAHYDHLGKAETDDGETVIYNGAWDNASGTAALLEVAGALKEVESTLRRSALIMFVGAEEMGLLGSLYWSRNPTVHPGNVSANFNLDSMQIFGETRDLTLVGYGRNTLTDYFKKHAQQHGRTIAPDPEPQQGFFYRSDHFSYARIGIPAIYPNPGREYINKPANFSQTADSVRAANYHQPGDEINEYWDVLGMESDTRLMFYVAYDVINADEMMRWEEGDEFRAVRQQMLSQAP